MKIITINNRTFILVEVPKDAEDFVVEIILQHPSIRYTTNGAHNIEILPLGNYTIIGNLSDIMKDETQCEQFTGEPHEFLLIIQKEKIDLSKEWVMIESK